MKTLVLYKTKAGSTKQYAEWIHEETVNSNLADLDKFNIEEFVKYDIIVIGSRTYMNKIQAQKFLEENWDILKDKKVYLFSVGMTPWKSKESKDTYNLIPENIRNSLAGHVKLPGRIKLETLSFFEKIMVKLRGSNKKDKTDKVDKKNIKPILDYINSLNPTK